MEEFIELTIYGTNNKILIKKSEIKTVYMSDGKAAITSIIVGNREFDVNESYKKVKGMLVPPDSIYMKYPAEDIIEECNMLVKMGYKEITLLGQNVNAYGKDLYSDYNLANLLSDVSDTGIERIRFVTSHPWDFTDEMVDIIASRDNIMPYIHLPLQSGSDKILKLMNRKYTSSEYLKLYNSIRSKVKNSSVTTDIIVGFPGETEEDFQDTLKIVNECKFDGAFTFAFSPRENTPAALMKNVVDEDVKMDRLHRLNELVNKYSNEANAKMNGTIVKCLVTGLSDKDKTKVCGYTENMKLVNIDGPKELIGNIVSVKIIDTKSFSMDGVYIKD